MFDSKWLIAEQEMFASRNSEFNNNSTDPNELFYRQNSTQLIQDMGSKLKVSQLCINSAIVYFHRFYAFHPFALFHHHDIGAAAFFLSAKVTEHPRKAIDVIKILGMLLDPKRHGKMSEEEYPEKIQELLLHENFLLKTLGFELDLTHPHSHIIKVLRKLEPLPGFNDLGKHFYFMATSSLHLTTLCLKYPSEVIAAFCIEITCKWVKYELPETIEGQVWYEQINENITQEMLDRVRYDFMAVLEKSPPKTKAKIEMIMNNRKTEVPKPPITHRSVLQTLHEKSKNINHIPNQASKDVSGNKSLLGKRPHTEDQSSPNFQEASTSRNSQNTVKVVKRQPITLEIIPGEDSSKYGKVLSPLIQKHVKESSESSDEPPRLNKRKFSEEESDREIKLQKTEDYTNLPVLTSKPKFGEISPESSSNEPLSSPDLINVVNMKLTILPAEIVPYNQMYLPPSTAGNFDAEVLAYNPDFINNPSDFNIDAC